MPKLPLTLACWDYDRTGPDWRAYALEPNVLTLTSFLSYQHEQGLSERLCAPRDLFGPETLEFFKI